MKAITAYWQKLPQREQRVFSAVGILVVLGVIYGGIIAPLQSKATSAEQNLKAEAQLLEWVSNKAIEIEALRQAGGGNKVNPQAMSMPINQVVTATVKKHNLEIDRLQPQQDDLQVWLKPTSFNNLLGWLDDLVKNYGIQVKLIDLQRTEKPGVVEVKRLQLGRG